MSISIPAVQTLEARAESIAAALHSIGVTSNKAAGYTDGQWIMATDSVRQRRAGEDVRNLVIRALRSREMANRIATVLIRDMEAR